MCARGARGSRLYGYSKAANYVLHTNERTNEVMKIITGTQAGALCRIREQKAKIKPRSTLLRLPPDIIIPTKNLLGAFLAGVIVHSTTQHPLPALNYFPSAAGIYGLALYKRVCAKVGKREKWRGGSAYSTRRPHD